MSLLQIEICLNESSRYHYISISHYSLIYMIGHKDELKEYIALIDALSSQVTLHIFNRIKVALVALTNIGSRRN